MLWACLTIAILGLVLLALGVALKEAPDVQIGSVTRNDVGSLVAVEGVTTRVNFNGEHLFLTMNDGTGAIRVVMFGNDLVRQHVYGTDVVEGSRLRVEGRVEVYKGSLELVAQRLTLL